MDNHVQYRLEVQRTSLSHVLIAMLVLIFGIAVLYMSSCEIWHGLMSIRSLVADFGKLLIASVFILILWEIIGKRLFLNEILSKVGVASEIRNAGILEVPFDISEIKWDSLFKGVTNIDLFFSYAKTWRGTHEIRLRNVVKEKNVKLTVVLPDPNDSDLMVHLAKAFDKKNVEEVRSRIRDAIDDFKALQKEAGHEGAEIKIFLSKFRPTFAYYRFDDIVVISLFPMAKGKATVPHFVLSNKGNLFSYLLKQFDILTDPVAGNSRELISTEQI